MAFSPPKTTHNTRMPPDRDASGTAAYKPTSLDFINLPNPIEPTQPHAASQKHPLNGTPRLEKSRLEGTSNQHPYNFILDPSAELPNKRQKTSDNTLDLPRLPVRNAAKRLRIPPTLSGLHQPPPDAGLLPSINTEQPQVPPPRQQEVVLNESTPTTAAHPETVAPKASRPEDPTTTSEKAPTPLAKRPKRNKWNEEETASLLKGVAHFGIGNWTKILNCSDYQFNNRSALDLKDRFRVCCPDHYQSGKPSQSIKAKTGSTAHKAPSKAKSCPKGPAPERVSSVKLEELGINEPFVKASRRSRHGYSAEEDEAILEGFQKYGNSWATIQQNSDFDLSHRKTTDLRDRFRTKYPEEYAKAGLALRQEKLSSVPKRVVRGASDNPATSDGEATAQPVKAKPSTTTSLMPEIINKENVEVSKPVAPKRSQQPSLFSLDDVFLGVPFGAEDGDSEQVVLDRGILDWPNDVAKSSTIPSIDPRMTLKLPKPVSSVQTAVPVAGPSTNSTALPSLATLLPETTNPEQFELPSLMQWFDAVDNEGRPTIPPLEELMG